MPQILYKILTLIIILTNYQKCPVPLTMWFYPRVVVLFYSLSKVQGKHMSNKENCSVNEAYAILHYFIMCHFACPPIVVPPNGSYGWFKRGRCRTTFLNNIRCLLRTKSPKWHFYAALCIRFWKTIWFSKSLVREPDSTSSGRILTLTFFFEHSSQIKRTTTLFEITIF